MNVTVQKFASPLTQTVSNKWRERRCNCTRMERNACAWFIVENTCFFVPKFTHITARIDNIIYAARYHPKPSAIENKVKKGALWFCAHLNLWLLSFNNPEYRLLQACFNVKMPSSLIFEPLAPTHLGVIRYWTVNNSTLYPPTLTLTTYFCGPFHLGHCDKAWIQA